MGEGWGEGKTTAPISDDPKTQGRLKSPANPNLVSGNRLKEYNGIEYTYDALGNLIYRQLPDGENQYYQYDLENQLVRAEIKKPAGNTEIWTYAYDPFGRRLSKERQDKLAWTSTEPKRTLRLGRQPPVAGVHLQRQLHLYLHRPRQLRTAGASLP